MFYSQLAAFNVKKTHVFLSAGYLHVHHVHQNAAQHILRNNSNNARNRRSIC
jgi:hypothetical protein